MPDPFKSFEQFCADPNGFGLSPDDIEAKLNKHGTNQHTRGYPALGGYNIASSKRGTNSRYTLARLERDAPKLAAKVRNGELSANAAAIEAGFRENTVTGAGLSSRRRTAGRVLHYRLLAVSTIQLWIVMRLREITDRTHQACDKVPRLSSQAARSPAGEVRAGPS
jgi:hypothetical protein